MASLFNLSDTESLNYEDSELGDLRLFFRQGENAQDSSDNDYYSDNSDEEDPFGPDLEDLEPPPSGITIPPSPTSSSTSLPLYQPALIRPPITAALSALTIQAMEALLLIDPIAPYKSRFHSIGARISALALLDVGTSQETIENQTQITQSGVKKLKRKAIDCSQRPGERMVVQVEHVEDGVRSRRPGTSQKIVQLIL